MEKKILWKTVGLGILALFALLYTLPTWVGADRMPAWYTSVFSKRLNYGLDLQGGLELRFAVDYKKAIGDNTLRMRESFQAAIADALAQSDGKEFEKLSDADKAPYLARFEIKRTDFDTLTVTFQSPADGDILNDDLARRVDFNFARTKKTETEQQLKLTDTKVSDIKTAAVAQALQIIRKRVEAFGLTEPIVRQSGDINIEVQMPGVRKAQMDIVRERIGQTAQLMFRIADHNSEAFYLNTVKPKLTEYLDAHKDRAPTLEMKKAGGQEYYLRAANKSELVAFVKDLPVPDDKYIGYELVEPEKGKVGQAPYWRTVWLSGKVELTGEHLTRAVALFDQQNRPYVSLEFDTTGANQFEATTDKHTGEDLAIMLDEDMYSAPRIKEKIGGGRARIDLGSRRSPQEVLAEAKALETVLATGAYKAPVHKVHDSEVGPSLGQEAIDAGKNAMLLGAALVILFMIMYYKRSGVYANVALIVNMLLMFAALVSFNAALTLPGLAGIALTVGMAVDANVLIFERIREELRAGKSPRAAVEQGFDRAFWTIFDSQLTTALAGVILMKFTTGAIYGFAVTLLIGIITSVFTAIVITRLCFDIELSKKGVEKLSV